MSQKKVLKMRPATKMATRIIIAVLVVVITVFSFYFYRKNKLENIGYSSTASNNIIFKFKYDYALSNPNNKTLNKAFESKDYKEKNLDKYKNIKYQNHENLIKNINTLLDKKYTTREISMILAHGSDQDVTEFAKKEKVKYLEEFYSYPYAKLKYYDRYLKYSNEEGEDEETTVILINLNLDKEAYTDCVKVNGNKIDVLVNKHFCVDKDFIPKDLVTVKKEYTIDGDSKTKGKKEAVNAAISMIKDAEKDGQKILINSGYRSYQDQQEVYDTYFKLYGENYVKKYVVNPGFSEHQTGLAFDFASGNKNVFKESTEYEWMINNSYKYGFCYRYQKKKEFLTEIKEEPWHFRYVGKKVAKKIYDEKLSLEEYYAEYGDK